MINFKHVLIVFKKEMKDLFRDRKTIIGSLLVPLIIFPLLMLVLSGGLGKMMSGVGGGAGEVEMSVYVKGSENDHELLNFAKDTLFANSKVKCALPADPQKALEDKDIVAIIEITDPNYYDNIINEKTVPIKIVYDEMNPDTRLDALTAVIARFNSAVLEQRLIDRGISPEVLTPVRSDYVTYSEYFNIEKREGSENMFLQMMLPYIAAIFVATAGLGAAIDLVAGEKERNTLEPLLSTAANRNSILVGKFFVVVVFTMLGVLSQSIGMLSGFSVLARNSGMDDFMSGGVNLSVGVWLLAFAELILMGMTFSCITLSISAMSRSYKEAQTYSGYVVFIPAVVGMASMFMTAADIQWWMMLLPVINVVASLKLVLGGGINYTFLLVGVLSSLVYMLCALYFVRKLFSKEKYLFRA